MYSKDRHVRRPAMPCRCARGIVFIVLLWSQVVTTWAGLPLFTLQPTNLTVLAGQTVELVATVEGDPTPDLRWYFQANELPDGNAPNLVLLQIHTNQAGAYQLMASNSFGVAWSDVAILTVIPVPPAIQQQPTNLTVFEGQSARFEVIPAQGPPPQLQWRFNGVDLPGRIDSVLTLETTRMTNAGEYTVVVSNPYGSITSQVAVLTINPLPATAGWLDQNFATGSGAETDCCGTQVNAVVTLRDGRILIGGDFTRFDGVPRRRVARLLSNGALDPSFDPQDGPDRPVLAVAEQVDGRFVIGGSFSSVAGHPRACLARLNPDGSLDESFVADLPSAVFGIGPVDVRAVLVQPDGRILHAGSVYYLGRREADGSLDPTFRSFIAEFSGGTRNDPLPAFALATDADDKILFGAYFGLRRFHSAGAIDTSFTPNPPADSSSQVHAVIVLRGGRILAGGNFTTLRGARRRALACLEADGSVSATFANVFTNFAVVNALATMPDGKVLVAGMFNLIAGVPCSGVARLHPDGTLDQSFNSDPRPGISPPPFLAGLFPATVNALAIRPDGSTVIGGDFNTVSGFPRGAVAQLHSDTPAAPRILTQPASRIVAAGKTVSLFVTGSYLPDTEHQWRLNGANLSGATNAVLELPNLGNASSGDYAVVLKNSLGAVTSDVATVTVTAPAMSVGATDITFGAGAGADGPVLCSATTLGGRILIGGLFRHVHGVARDYVARLYPDGTLDETFVPGSVQLGLPGQAALGVVALASDELGRVYLGGSFTNIQGALRRGAARLNVDGSVDLAYGNGEGVDAVVHDLARQSDGTMFIGGEFVLVDGAMRPGLARLDAAGRRDASFAPNLPGAVVYSLELQAGGVLAGGDFQFAGAGHLHRFTPSGAVDLGFRASSTVLDRAPREMVVDPATDKVYLAVPAVTVAVSMRILCLNANGSAFAGFNNMVAASGTVRHLALDGCGRLLVGTTSTNVNGAFRTHLARLDANGILDETIHPTLDGTVYSILPEAGEDSVFVGGEFSFVNGIRRRGFARLLGTPVGTPAITKQPSDWAAYTGQDFTLSIAVSCPPVPSLQWFRNGQAVPDATNTTLRFPNALTSQGGQYEVVVSNVSGLQTSAVVTVTVDPPSVRGGTVDFDFFPGTGPGPDAPVRALALQADGKLWIGGEFTNVQGVARQSLARLNQDGSLDFSFDPASFGSFGSSSPSERPAVNALAFQADGALLVGGKFLVRQNTFVFPSLVRIAANGLLDSSFNTISAALPETRAILVQPEGRILLGRSGSGLVALRPSGLRDSGFLAQANSSVLCLARAADGGVVAGGAFDTVNAQSRPRVVRLRWDGSVDREFDPGAGPNDVVNAVAVQPDGKVIIGGLFTQVAGEPRNRIARLNPNGTLDSSFNPDVNGAVNAVALAPNGGIFLAGNFTAVTNHQLMRVALLNPDGTIDLSFRPGTGADGNVSALLLRPDGRLDLGGSFTFFDEVLRPRVVQVHGQLLATDIRLQDNGFNISVGTSTGRTYWLDATESLAAPTWTPVSSVNGDGLVQTLTDSATRASRFYRVRAE